jgi:N-methylhydantoinase A
MEGPLNPADPSQTIAAGAAYFGHATNAIRAKIYDRTRLRPSNVIAGRAIIEQLDATTIVLPDMTARVEPYVNLILEAAT